MKPTQESCVIEMLKTQGEVTRNGALQMYISRLGAIIWSLKKEGWDIKGEWRKNEKGKDYVYYLVSRPTKIVTRHKIENGVAIPYQEKILV